MHYSRFKAHGDPAVGGKVRQSAHCSVEGCETQPLAKNLCRKHYYAAKRPTPPERAPKPPEECSITNCTSPSRVRGWCGAQYQRWRRFGDPEHFGAPAEMTCAITGCERIKNARGLCNAHYYRWRKFGDPEATPIRASPNLLPRPIQVCVTCGIEFAPGTSAARKYCGRKCARAKRGGSVNRRAWVERLGERDGWTCHLCQSPVDPRLYWPTPLAGSVDHKIPVSRGGNDAEDNLALAHLTCNTARKNAPLTV